ncbi:MAG: glycoside hydrolase family 27 protein [Oscillospiraceae bacterium]|nr:glycoside hydrolase family 27 protein [Oscillospiraceae bacterium]
MQKKDTFALRPPMGWNSWDCYGAAVNEEQLLGNARYMAEHLKDYGWEYVVCDIQWYEPKARSNFYNNFTELEMDEYSRLIPAVNRFPSAAGGKGFAPIAERIHAMGLKFGIHIMRGIPRQAVHRNTKIMGSDKTARQIASGFSVCSWNTDMYGVNARAQGAQEYYNSLFSLYASWGVDFVKVDDIANTEFQPHNPYSAREEIEMIRKAIDACGRDMVLSLSPGPAVIGEAFHLSQNANMWRMTGDFWDHWDKLYAMFERCEKWVDHVKAGSWPDCDMLPLGKISKNCSCLGDADRYTNFTADEQKTMLTLWAFFRSPLILGGELRENRPEDLALITNREIISINQNSTDNRQLRRSREEAIWCCTDENGNTALALFNLSDETRSLALDLNEQGICGSFTARDLWSGETFPVNGIISVSLAPHAVKTIRLEKE